MFHSETKPSRKRHRARCCSDTPESVMNKTEVAEFVDAWVQAWNAHDLDRVLEHFCGDVVFSSPLAVQLVAGSNGVISGKPALRSYWEEGLRRFPDLQFEVLSTYIGVSTLVINYPESERWLSQRSSRLRR